MWTSHLWVGVYSHMDHVNGFQNWQLAELQFFKQMSPSLFGLQTLWGSVLCEESLLSCVYSSCFWLCLGRMLWDLRATFLFFPPDLFLVCRPDFISRYFSRPCHCSWGASVGCFQIQIVKLQLSSNSRVAWSRATADGENGRHDLLRPQQKN